MDPETNSATLFVPQGIGADLIATMEGFSREDVDAFALESQKRATAARAEGGFAASVVPVKDWLGQTILDQDEFIKPRTTMEGLASLKPAFEQMGAMGFDAVALQRYPQVERIHHVHHAGNSSGIVDGAAAAPDRLRSGGQDARPQAARPHRGGRAVRRRPDHHAHRPHARSTQGAGQGRPDHRPDRPVRGQRGLCRRAHEAS
jgi:acetyl-CoA acetyltransferase